MITQQAVAVRRRHQLLLAGAEEEITPEEPFYFTFGQAKGHDSIDEGINDFSFFLDGSSSSTHQEVIKEDTNGFLFVENVQRNRLPQDWILLDNQSTVNVFSNRSLLRNIRETTREMVIRCNAGVTRTRMIGDLPGFAGEVWYNPDGIANILSLSDVKRHYRVTYDSNASGSFLVHKDNGEVREFVESASGLYYFSVGKAGCEPHHVLAHVPVDPVGEINGSASNDETAENNGENNCDADDAVDVPDNVIPPVSGQAVVTVASKKSKYTKRSYARAVTARQFQDAIG